MKGKIPPTEVRDEHVLIDVRSPHEFATEKVPGARNIPLGDLEEQCGVLAEQPNLVLVCASGMRAQKARDILAERGIPAQVLEGGVKAWAQHGLPLQKGMASGISIERQVRIVAGFLAAMGGFLAILVHPWSTPGSPPSPLSWVAGWCSPA